MPKVRLLLDGKEYDPLAAVLLGYAERRGMSKLDLANLIGFTNWRTAEKYFNHPERHLTALHYRKLRRALDIPREDLQEAIIR